MDSHNTNERWLTVYKYFLMAAVALSVIGAAKFIVSISGQFSGSTLVGMSVWALVKTGLFVFALWSMRRVGEKWVRELQLLINGVAVIIVIIGFVQPSSYNTFIHVGSYFVFPIADVIPWKLVSELSLGFLVSWATSIASLTFAAYFFFRWLKWAPPRAAERQTAPWRKQRIRAGVLTALLGLLLGIVGLAFGQQMAFLSGVMSGVGPSGISIPFPVVAIVVGIIIGGLMFCGEQGRGRPMIWLAAVTAPLLTISVMSSPVFILIVLAISIYLIWVLRKTKPAKVSE